jgi:hypothetical protein
MSVRSCRNERCRFRYHEDRAFRVRIIERDSTSNFRIAARQDQWLPAASILSYRRRSKSIRHYRSEIEQVCLG